MSGRRIVVVGASTGLGRCLGIGLARRGADVALLARTEEKLVEAAKEAGPGTLAIRCDATDEASCRSAIEEAASGLGGIDSVVYSAALMSKAEEMFLTGKAAYPVERTLLTSGLVAAGLQSLADGRRNETPHLTLRYRAPRESLFWRS